MKKSEIGFTMVEILISITIVVVLMIAAVATIDPVEMVNRAQDTRRVADIRRVKIGLEEYFNDKACYPSSLDFGGMWSINGTPFLELPQDPSYPSESYFYTSGAGCPRWYAIFYRQLSKKNRGQVQAAEDITEGAKCNIPASCLPVNYQTSWGCLTVGNIDCNVVTSFVLPKKEKVTVAVGSTIPTPTPTRIGYTLAPTGVGYTAVPTGIGSTQHDKVGVDGSWCDDSNNSGISAQNAYCRDASGTHTDFCLDTVAKQYYCGGTWDGHVWSNVGCNLGGYVCPTFSNRVCIQGGCVYGVGGTGVGSTAVPTGIGSTGVGATGIGYTLFH